MSDAPTPPKKIESKTGAGAAGVGGGTLVVVIANNLREGNPLKPWLLLAAPSISVALSVVWLWLQVKFSNYLRDREVKALIKEARKILEEALDNPNTSDEHRAGIKKQLEDLEQINIGRYMERIKSIRIITDADVQQPGR